MRFWLPGLFVLCSLAAGAAEFDTDVRPGEGVTERRMLSDYFEPLAGTPMDTEVFFLDSGEPGAVGLMIGGTHGNELADGRQP